MKTLKLIRSNHLLVHSARFENFAFAILEFFSAGRAGVIPDDLKLAAFNNSDCFLTFKTGSSDSIASALSHAVKLTTDELDSMGERAHSFICLRFNYDALVTETNAVISRITLHTRGSL